MNPQINKLENLHREANLGSSAEQVLKALDPLMEKRLGQLLDEFRQTPAELGALLDLRAKICEVWRIRKELTNAAKLGKSALETLEGIMAATKAA